MNQLLGCWFLCLLSSPPQTAAPEPATVQPGRDLIVLADTRPVLVRLHVEVDGKPLESAWNDFVGGVFRSLDKNGTGMLDDKTLQRLPPSQLVFSSQFAFAFKPRPWALAGSKVSLEDLKKQFRSNGGAPFQLRFNSRNQQQALYLSVNGDVGYAPRSPDALHEALFGLLDTNKDGKLSKGELARAPEILLRKDADDDEMVTPDELLPIRGDMALSGVEEIMMDPLGRAPPSFVLLASEESPRSLGRRILTRYSPSATPQPPGKPMKQMKPMPPTTKVLSGLTQKQIGLDDATFKELDVDDNGKLDAEELAQFAQRQPDMELRVRLGKKGEGDSLQIIPRKGSPAPLYAQLRKTKTGTVMLNLGTIRLEFRADATPFSPGEPDRIRERYQFVFKNADLDSNGYIDRSEAERNVFFRNWFNFIDLDGDGKIYEKELIAFLDQVESLRGKARASISSLEVSDQDQGLFDLLDTNRDGRLSVREMRNAIHLIESLDQDADGTGSCGESLHD